MSYTALEAKVKDSPKSTGLDLFLTVLMWEMIFCIYFSTNLHAMTDKIWERGHDLLFYWVYHPLTQRHTSSQSQSHSWFDAGSREKKRVEKRDIMLRMVAISI